MPRKRFKTEQIVSQLRQVEVLVANGQLTQACREAGISEQTCYATQGVRRAEAGTGAAYEGPSVMSR